MERFIVQVPNDANKHYMIDDATDAIAVKFLQAFSTPKRQIAIGMILGNIIEHLRLTPEELLRMCELSDHKIIRIEQPDKQAEVR
jgi:hypothetical protein